MTTKPGDPQAGSATDSAAGINDNSRASVGFILLAVLITFVAVWMTVQGRQALQRDGSAAVSSAEILDGFSTAFWQLPDEPLLGFVEISAGEFLMGSNPAVDRQAYENERWSQTARQGTVNLPEFYIGRYEVTVAQYREFVRDTGRAFVPETLAAEPSHPVTNVTWTDALAYARWLQGRLQQGNSTPQAIASLLAAGWQISLPTEAQWEKAARGPNGSIYPWGNQVMQGRANFGTSATQPVGSFPCPECQFGLLDMSGNVWELTRSPFQPYPYSFDDDRNNLAGDALWVMRGGSYADGAANIRAAVRGGVDPGVRNDTIGFRLVLTLP
jgi:formylglycine-generating enzyme required for sulfatase activity